MILTVEQGFQIELPTGWRELPPAHVLAVGSWLFEWVEELGVAPELKPQLIHSLGEAGAFVLANLNLNRSWVAVLDPSDHSRVCAVASIVAMSTDEASNTEVPIISAVVWSTNQTETTIAGHPAVVLHNIGVYTDTLGDPTLAERFVGTVYPAHSDSVVRLEIFAEDTTVFGDIVTLGTRVLYGLALVGEA